MLKELIKKLENSKLNSEIKFNRLLTPQEMHGARWQAAGQLVKAFYQKFTFKYNLVEKKMRASVYMFSEDEINQIIKALKATDRFIDEQKKVSGDE